MGCTVLYRTVLYYTVLYCTVQYSTVQYSRVQYGTVQYSIVQYSTVQYSTVHYITLKTLIQPNTYQTSGSRPLWARSKFGLWYAALGVVKMLHTDNKQQIRK